MRRTLAVFAAVAAVTLSTMAGLPAAAEPAQAMSWGPCEEIPDDPTLQCATLRVPLDWAHPRGPKIDLGVARRLATDPAARIGSLLINPGGPGGSGRAFAIFGAEYFSPELRRHFDLVGFDPRGIGRSAPVMCTLDLILAEPSFLMTSQREFDQRLDYNRRLREDCRRHTGPVIDHLDMISVVRDMDALRAALGDRKLTYYGISYGSLDGQQYAELFPDRIRAIVADSNMDHSLGTRAFLDTEAATTEDAWREFVAWCDRTESCALHGRDVRAVWHDLLDRAERGQLPDPFDPDRTLRPEELIGFVFGAFYDPAWAQLAEVLAALHAGDPLPFPPPPPPGEEPELVNFPPLAIFCNDWSLPIRDYREFAAHLRRMERIAPDMRFSSAATPITVGCLGSPERIANPQHKLRVRDAATPLLLLNALHDPATGYNWATNAARQLGREAVLLTYDGWGHGVYGRSDCTTGAVDRYLISLTLPARGTHCPAVEPGDVAAQQQAGPPGRPALPGLDPRDRLSPYRG
ncbi:MAG TPA: alpha/beta hydrolase [Actinophytocola sp.]|uniref:alpha/beta hydrolase n=1 Tax=Actinophytocola sp. TaxID=1872138 RepID=UPI002DDD0536|nr:alpha/beta hydrolase [Actinophytocola sp.]HEV2783703.1 alpha/beta hydrolase [Actinophytocola sp.]